MVQFNFAKREVQCKVVYYGPARSGKTTNLRYIHANLPPRVRGALTSIATDGDRTLFFDFLTLDLGQVAGIHTKVHVYAVPWIEGQNAMRVLVLEGADGIVFVADSARSRIGENAAALENLRENLAGIGRGLDDMPIVMQWNKSDADEVAPEATLQEELNAAGRASFAASAQIGTGVFPTLKAITQAVLESATKFGATAAVEAGAPAAAAPAHAEPRAARRREPEPVLAGVASAGEHEGAGRSATHAPAPGGPRAASFAAAHEEEIPGDEAAPAGLAMETPAPPPAAPPTSPAQDDGFHTPADLPPVVPDEEPLSDSIYRPSWHTAAPSPAADRPAPAVADPHPSRWDREGSRAQTSTGDRTDSGRLAAPWPGGSRPARPVPVRPPKSLRHQAPRPSNDPIPSDWTRPASESLAAADDTAELDARELARRFGTGPAVERRKGGRRRADSSDGVEPVAHLVAGTVIAVIALAAIGYLVFALLQETPIMPGPMVQKSDEELRKERLTFYREEMAEINATLRGFLARAKANAAFLVDKDGHLITREGVDDKIDVDAICGLVAGAFAATRQMATILGEDTFLNLFHQGKRKNIQVTLIGNRTILSVVFDDTTTIGMVRLYLAEAANTLTTIFQRILERQQKAGFIDR